ncbi:MAG: NAD-dependent epimerase/dehydratase family protein [Alphaproteobacteria bacterium]|nr:MAG: NAD-dependent epimerase/dehydratase family protein [Alphaproteobacteria bacterium]
MRLFLLGATGNTGRRILRFALQRGHEVTAFVRNQNKLMEILGGSLPQDLRLVVGDIENSAVLAAAMAGHDAVINAAGYVTEGDRFTRLVQTVIQQTMNSLGADSRFWQFGGAAVLDIPGTDLKGVDLPLVPKVYEAHRTNLNALTKSALDWSMLCPGPMIDAPNGLPTKGLRVSADHWPVPPPPAVNLLPKAALAFAFKQRVPELTISYEDAADVILNNLDRNGPFSRRRVGVALPAGQRNVKVDVPGR